jgi:hypothetical protein
MSESLHQRALFRWAELQTGTYPELRMLYASANGGKRHRITAGRMKAEGVRAGVPDICLPVRTRLYGALYIELKRPKEDGKAKGVLSDDQKRWLGDLQAFGNFAGVAFGWLEAKDMILAYIRGDA